MNSNPDLWEVRVLPGGVLAENAHPFENPALRIDNPFGLSGLIGRLPSG